MKKHNLLQAAVLSGVLLAQLACAGTESGGAPAASTMSEGEVRKVDKDAGKITIKHGPLTNLDMPAMTMVFRARDPSLLEQVKPGDQINFVASRAGGQITVTNIQVKK
jgi:Cu(I)/Ag(I) efflux system protein CusF